MDHKRKEQSDNYLRELLPFVYITGPFLIVMSIFRLLFYVDFAEEGLFGKYSGDVLRAFFLGFRFDLSVLAYLQALPILVFSVAYVSGRTAFYAKVKERVMGRYYAVTFTALLYFLGLDHFYYGFYHSRIDIMIFGIIEDDTWALIQTFWQNYPVIPLFGALILFYIGFQRGASKLFLKVPQNPPAWIQKHGLSSVRLRALLAMLLFPALTVLAARGSLGLFPLEPMDAIISQDPFINKLSPNGVVMFVQATHQRKIQSHRRPSYVDLYGYRQDVGKAYRDYMWPKVVPNQAPSQAPGGSGKWGLEEIYRGLEKGGHKAASSQSSQERPHVVLIVMESMGGYWLKFQSPEFDVMGELKEHYREDYLFLNFVSASGGTIGSITSILSGLPLLTSWPLASEQEFLSTPLPTSIAAPFKSEGYEVRFLYAGKVGWRNLYDYAMTMGFDSVEGEHLLEELIAKENSGKIKNPWGIYDEYLLSYALDELEKAEKPQFLLILTTTNHPPYDLPPVYNPVELTPPSELERRFVGDRELTMERLQAYRYGNDSLGKFLTRLKESPFGESTIVGVTGDHSFQIINFEKSEVHLRTNVPFYVYAPAAYAPKTFDPQTYGSYLNIMPTLVSLAMPDKKFIAFQKSMFEGGYNFTMNADMVVTKNGLIYGLASKNPHFAPWQKGEGGVDDLFGGSKKIQTPTPFQERAIKNFYGTIGLTEYILTTEAAKQ